MHCLHASSSQLGRSRIQQTTERSKRTLPTRAALTPQGAPELNEASSTAARRQVLIGGTAVALSAMATPSAQAGFIKEKKKKLTDADYEPSAAVGLRIHELEVGNFGSSIKQGDKVTVHFDVLFRGIDVVSSRSARLLGGNRTIAEPYQFVAGQPVSEQAVKKISDSSGGLFSGSSGPKPPPALSTAVLGMKRGGKRSILVDNPELGFPKGIQELPPGQTFELRVDILDVSSK